MNISISISFISILFSFVLFISIVDIADSFRESTAYSQWVNQNRAFAFRTLVLTVGHWPSYPTPPSTNAPPEVCSSFVLSGVIFLLRSHFGMLDFYLFIHFIYLFIYLSYLFMYFFIFIYFYLFIDL